MIHPAEPASTNSKNAAQGFLGTQEVLPKHSTMQFQLTLESWVLASDGLAYISAAAAIRSVGPQCHSCWLTLLACHTPVQSLAFLKNFGCSRKYSLATTASCTTAFVT